MKCRLPTRLLAPLCGGACALAVGIACLFGTLPAGRTQEKQPEKADKAPDAKAELAEFLDDAKNYTIRTVTKPEVELKFHVTPVLNFTNPERNQELGSVFVWLDDNGRPAVLGQFFKHDAQTARRKKHAMHSLAAVELEAKFRDKIAWAPEVPGVEWKSFPEAPAVAAAQGERRRQMKRLAEPFKVDLFESKDKVVELRRAPTPLFEYSAPKAGVTDGAIFSYLIATDPEAILVVEAFDEKGKTGFRYAFARFHFRRLTAKLADKTVWEAEYDGSMIYNTIGQPATMKKVYNSYVP
jgi:hypothetical protein